MIWSEWVWGIAALLLTIMILSYVIGDNAFFRLASAIFIGLTAGYLAVLLIQQVIWPYLIQPLMTGPWQKQLWMMIPLALIFLLLLSQVPRFSKYGSIPLAYLAGLSAAVAIGGAVFGTLIPQSVAVIDRFDRAGWVRSPTSPWLTVINAFVMLIGTVGTLSYFHFGRRKKPEHENSETKRPVILEWMSKVGQVFIGITLGAVFAGIFSSALVALIDRISFLGQFILQLIGGD